MKVSERPGTKASRVEDLQPFVTPEALRGGIIVEPKYNGFRVVAQKDAAGRVFLMSEEGLNRTEPIPNVEKTLPGLAEELRALPGPYALDCEFMAYADGQAVPRRDLARYRSATAPVDDSAVRLECFRALYLPKGGNLLRESEEENRALLERFLGEGKRVAVAPRKVAKTEAALRAAIEWASKIPGSEGAMLKLAGTTYSLGGETDSWAKLRLTREVHAIVYRRDPVKDSPGTYTLFGAVGPIPAAERDRWTEVVEVGGRYYVPMGKTFNVKLDADVGDKITVEVTELLLDESRPRQRLHWFLPVVRDEKWVGEPDTVERIRNLAEASEVKKVVDAAWEKTIPLLKLAEERYVLGVVLEPETVDSQRDIYSAEEIRQAAHKFMADYRNTGLMHRRNVNDKVTILESYIAPCDFSIGDQTVRKGTWLLAVRVKDDEMWAAVKDGSLTGFSIGGSAVRRREAEATI